VRVDLPDGRRPRRASLAVSGRPALVRRVGRAAEVTVPSVLDWEAVAIELAPR
jgi:hypothetical protein